MIRSALVALSLALTAPAAQAASLAYDTVTATPLNTIGFAATTGPGADVALSFVAEASGVVQGVDLYLSTDQVQAGTGTGTARFRFFADGIGMPGAALGDWTPATTSASYTGPELLGLSGFGAATLTAGHRYWLIADHVQGSNVAWHAAEINFSPVTTWRYSGTLGGSWLISGAFLPAARITVEPVPAVPLPGGLALLAGALGVLTLRQWRSAASRAVTGG